jgi:predicted MFS family arabinose efflux permease
MTSVLVGLNTSATYVGVSIAGTLGAAAIPLTGSHNLGYLAAIPVAIAIVVSALATRRIASFAGSKGAVTA